MKQINTSRLSGEECWSVQINGTSFCESCKFTGLTACMGKEIRKTGFNKKGHKIGRHGIIED